MQRHKVLLGAAVFASCALGWTNTWGDESNLQWSYFLDVPPSTYAEQGRDPPTTASNVSKVSDCSYIVKLDCVGCPFRLRELGSGYGDWEKPPRSNSLLLNFTVDPTTASLALNWHTLYPKPALHTFTTMSVFQAPQYLYAETLQKMINISMLDVEFDGVGTAYASFHLDWTLTELPTEDPEVEILHIDVVQMKYYPDTEYQMNQPDQRIVRIEVRKLAAHWGHPQHVEIKKVDLVDRFDAAREEAVASKLSTTTGGVRRVIYKEAEWDYYGKKGTWGHAWARFPKAISENMAAFFPILLIYAIVFPIAYCARRAKRRKAAAMAAMERSWKSIY